MESSKIAKALLNELEVQSDNRKSPIEHVWFSIQETAKCLGIKRELVRAILNRMVEIGILELKSKEPILYEFTERGKKIESTELVEML